MDLFGVGAMEAGLILVVTLLVVGPHRFPEIAREGGKWYRTARRYANEVMKDVRGAMEELETEVKTQTEDFKEIREIGRDLSTSGDQTFREIREIGSQTRDTMDDGDKKPASTTTDAAPAATDTTPTDEEAAPAPPARRD
jgi:Tat protein translocase TatB subunit